MPEAPLVTVPETQLMSHGIEGNKTQLWNQLLELLLN